MIGKRWFLLAIMSALVLLLSACSSNGLPKQPGDYDVQPKSVAYDGRDYTFYWVAKDNSLQSARLDNLKMVQDSRTYLEMRSDGPVLHLSPDDPVTVRGEDRQGSFDTFWFPFLLGRMTGGGGGPVIINQPYPGTPQTPNNVPTYHYPPSSDFGRDDTLNGSVTNNKPSTPDYSRVTPAPYAVSGKSSGAGGGTAATGKSGAASGQSGGTGSGSAATQKGGFQSGSSSYSSKSGGFCSESGWWLRKEQRQPWRLGQPLQRRACRWWGTRRRKVKAPASYRGNPGLGLQVEGTDLQRWGRFGVAVAYFLGLIAWEVWDFYWSDPAALFLSLLTIAYLLLIVTAYLRRGPDEPLGRGDWGAQLAALLGANLLTPLSLLPGGSSGLETLAVLASIAGLALSFWAVWHLGPAFSIVPEARRAVQTGPYRWVRHPLYLAGFVIGLGLLVAGFSPAALGLFLGFAGCQALRMGYEEDLLADRVPEYREYRQRTWALLPFIL
ncbi:MAG: isoprenylcysteine carboxylmethyltransferase family protein [Actinobacteria bacterium]|nr:isoprenylcysteine carboxylmethyltransferase family protein [Actinomycetota bacterium]